MEVCDYGDGDEQYRKEQQEKHYSFLNHLQSMARELPPKFQQRLSYDLLSSLASSLLDGTIFEIVTSLKEVQQLEERNLSGQRIKLINQHKIHKNELQRKHRDVLQQALVKPHTLPYLEAQCKEEMEKFEKRCEDEIKKGDMKIMLELDQKTMEQQSTLEKAGVPGFMVTNNSQDVRMQMHLLEFIIRLADMQNKMGVS